MKQFLKKIRFFVAILIVVWAATELFYRLVPNNYTVKNNSIEQNYSQCETLIFGNSHAFYGLNPAEFDDKAFNLANVSQTLFFDRLLFFKHADKMPKLKNIIITVEYSSLSQRDDHPELEWRKYFYESQMGLHTGSISPFDIKKYSMALVPRFSITLEAFKQYTQQGTLAECGPNGWAPKIGVNNQYNNPEMGKNIVQKHEEGAVAFDVNLKRLNDIIQACKAKNIKVFIVTMPVTSHYANAVTITKLNNIIQHCKAFTNSKDIFYLNLFKDERFNNTDFYDTDHLNTKGAAKCSKIVSDFIAAAQ